MATQEKAAQVIDRQIAELQEDIIQNKIDIADLFVKIYRARPGVEPNFDEFLSTIKEMNKMSIHLDKLAKNEAKLETLKNSKTAIEKAYLEECAQ